MANRSGSNAKLRIRLSGRAGESSTAQVSRQIREMIEGGRLKAGDTLPSEDGLADQLGVGRKVVRSAYGRLVEEGLLVRDFPRNKRVAGPKGGRSRGASAGNSRGAAAGKSAKKGSSRR